MVVRGKKTSDNTGNLYLVSAKTWYMQDYKNIWRSRDQGATWVKRDLPTDARLYKIIAPNETSVFASGPEGTFHSKDQGVTWEKLPICLSSCLIMESNRNGLLIMSNGLKTHYVSKDYGSFWQPFSIPDGHCIERIAISAKGQIALATRYNIFLSGDLKTWLPSIDETSVLKNNYREVTALYFDDQNFLYLGMKEKSLHRSQMPITLVANEGEGDLPQSITLSQNYPNPFNPSTIISFSLPQASEIVLEAFDLLGKRVSLLEKGWHAAGTHQVQFDVKDLPSGTYIYRLQVANKVISQKMTIVK